MHTATTKSGPRGEKAFELPIEGRDRLFKHALVCGHRRAAEVLPGARARQFERAPPFLDAPLFC